MAFRHGGVLKYVGPVPTVPDLDPGPHGALAVRIPTRIRIASALHGAAR